MTAASNLLLSSARCRATDAVDCIGGLARDRDRAATDGALHEGAVRGAAQSHQDGLAPVVETPLAEVVHRLRSAWLAGPALFYERGSCTRKSGSATPAPPLVPPPGANPVRIGIDVRANGRLQITLWRGSECNATYALVDKAEALARCLPEAIEEAIEFAREAA